MKILYAASEVYPFAASGGLADVAGSLPKAIRKRMHACRVVMPLYGDIKPEMRAQMKYVTSFSVSVAWRTQYCGVFEMTYNGVVHYFLDNEYYFKRPGIYGFYDDGERFAFFSRAVLEMLRHIDFEPEIIHCNDWQTALVPVYLNLFYRGEKKFRDIKTVLTIHNIQYQGKYGLELVADVLGLPAGATPIVEYDGCVNYMKGGIDQCNMITTVSPTYAEEILDPWYAHGLDRILKVRQFKLCGILNGIDTEVYDPETDPALKYPYSAENIDTKGENKKALQEELGLPLDDGRMLVVMVTRLVSHKGLDLVKYICEDMLQKDIQLAVLGSGDYLYEEFFAEMQKKYPDRMSFVKGFIPVMARKFYAGGDVLLMPSKSEPCGLAQMVALRYGTIPVVRATGGLKDSVIDMGDESGEGNGFTFQSYNAHDMQGAVERALESYRDKDGWRHIVAHGMQCDFSWKKSAAAYIAMYKKLLEK
ncbi:MAG: glycogen synthase GlgA [Oscillospiraceae bacterium]|nr:glycogen synthase GlgA [Oscillospiraceae bacterium]